MDFEFLAIALENLKIAEREWLSRQRNEAMGTGHPATGCTQKIHRFVGTNRGQPRRSDAKSF
jgi:hypothetical protein